MRDERVLLGLILFHLLAALPGLALFHTLGLLTLRPGRLLAAAGPAVLAGLIVTGIPLIALVAAGAKVNSLVTLVVLAIVTGVLVLVAVLTRGRLAPLAAPVETQVPSRAELLTERGLLAAAAVFFLAGVPWLTNFETLWDDANIWSLKALGLFHHDGLVDGLGRNPQLTGVHLDYPILQPLVESSFFRAIGGVDVRLWHAELWVLLGLAIWTLAWLFAPLGRRWPWVAVVGTLAVSGAALANITLGDADLLMAALIGCATASFGIWLERGHPGHALLGAVFIAGAASVKNEGLVFGTAVGVALVVMAAVGTRSGRWRDLLAAAGIVAVAVLPWQVWVSTNDAAARGTPSPWEVIDDPGFLVDRLDFLWRGLGQVIAQLMNTGEWGLLAPAFLVVAVVLLVAGHSRTIAGFHLLAAFLAYLSVAYVYWVTPFTDLGGFEQRTGGRIVFGIVFVVAAGLAHLMQLVVTRGPAAEGEPERERASEEPARTAA